MGKRYIDTEFFKHPFVRGLKAPYKMLYAFIFTDCDNAGIWNPEFETTSIFLDSKVERNTALKAFAGKIVELKNGKWFFPDFIQHQYPKGLRETNPAHTKIIDTLKKLGFLNENLVLISPLEGTIESHSRDCGEATRRGTMGMGKGMDMGKEEGRDMGIEEKSDFEKFIEGFNGLTGRDFRGDVKSRANFKARMKEGYTIEEILMAVGNCMSDTFHIQHPKYLTPEFITRSDKLETYRQKQIIPLNGKQQFDDSTEGRKRQQAHLKDYTERILSNSKAEGDS